MSAFESRWVELPAGVQERDGGLAPGFRAAGVAAGIKADGALDLGLLVCDSAQATSAARFTRSGVLAAPVLVTRERCALDRLRAVVANSGNANAATGNRGLDDAAKVQGAGAAATGLPAEQVGLASTGVIGVPLPSAQIVSALLRARSELSADGDGDLAEAIRTTDAFAKRATVTVQLSAGAVTISAQAKGAGMISPAFATMLCFVQTDAGLPAPSADVLLGATVARSFERITVDGQLSTNDTVILIAGGDGPAVEPESEDELRLGEALEAVLRALALAVVRDGEGARRVGRVVVRGGDPAGVERAARAVADSPLVKTALHGADPNWGRIAQAVGAALPGTDPLALDIAIEGVAVCAGGAAVPFDRDALATAVYAAEVEYEVGLPGEGAEVELFFSDLSHEYVTINAEYTS